MYLILSEAQAINSYAADKDYFGEFDSAKSLVAAISRGEVHRNGAEIVISDGVSAKINPMPGAQAAFFAQESSHITFFGGTPGGGMLFP